MLTMWLASAHYVLPVLLLCCFPFSCLLWSAAAAVLLLCPPGGAMYTADPLANSIIPRGKRKFVRLNTITTNFGIIAGIDIISDN